MKKRNYLLSLAIAASLLLTCLVGCGSTQETAEVPAKESTAILVEEVAEETATGGILCIKVNPEIAIHYDDNGLVTKLEARNADAKAIIDKYTGYEGKETHIVVKDLVAAIGDAGYFVEEVEGVGKRITIEIEVGSVLPNDTFVDKVVAEVKDYVSTKNYRNPIELEGNTNYGITDYNDTDYGPNNDGVTDYDITDYGVSPKQTATPAPAAAAAPASQPSSTPAPVSQAVTDYHITDYDATNYDDTDYGPNNDGVTDYDDTDYGPNNDGVTDYDDTDYGPNNDGVTDYNDHVTDYGNTNYDDHVTDYGNTNYDDHVTDYGSTNYDNDSHYDD